jgi:hypothetical protein
MLKREVTLVRLGLDEMLVSFPTGRGLDWDSKGGESTDTSTSSTTAHDETLDLSFTLESYFCQGQGLQGK